MRPENILRDFDCKVPNLKFDRLVYLTGKGKYYFLFLGQRNTISRIRKENE